MDDIENPARNAQWVWLEIHKFPKNFPNFNRNSRKTFQSLAKFWNSSRFWLSKLWNPAKKIGNPEILGTQFNVVHRGCMDIFWNSPLTAAILNYHCILFIKNRIILQMYFAVSSSRSHVVNELVKYLWPLLIWVWTLGSIFTFGRVV